jgi:hypothetical protein
MNMYTNKIQNAFDQLLKCVPSSSGRILTNKWVLIFIFIVGFYDVIHFYQRGNIIAFAIFFIVGFLTSFFSKNMIVIIVMSIAVSHLVAYGNKMSEGLKGKMDEEEDEEEEEVDEEEEEEEEVDVQDQEEVDSFVDAKDAIKSTSDSIKSTANDVAMLAKGKNVDDLPDQTTQLLKKQKELMANMDKLQPLLDTAEKFMGTTKKVDGFATLSSSYAEYK